MSVLPTFAWIIPTVAAVVATYYFAKRDFKSDAKTVEVLRD